MKEIWKTIKGYENYQISNLGNVYSSFVNRKLSPGKTQDGYYYVGLRDENSVRKNLFVHRLVAQAFIPNPENLPIINHKDENPSNNTVENLEWCSYSYNNTYNNSHLKRGMKQGDETFQYNINGELVKTYYSARLASKTLGISNSNIDEATKKQGFSHGYIWSKVPLTKEQVISNYKKHLEVFCNYDISEYARKNFSKKVLQYTKDGKFIKEYPSCQEAGRQLGFGHGLIARVCRGEAYLTHGYHFEYGDDN